MAPQNPSEQVLLRNMTPEECRSIGIIEGIGAFTKKGAFVTWGATRDAAEMFAKCAGFSAAQGSN